MQSEAGAMLTDTLLFLAQVVCCDACERSGGIRQGAGMRQEFPSARALQDAPGQSFLAGGAQQAAVEGAELTFAVVVGARQAGHIVGMKQTGRIATRDLSDGSANSCRRGAPALSCSICAR